MLDENLPTFYFRQTSDNPLSTILYFTQSGSDATAEYALQKLNPTLPQAKNKYAIALADASAQGIVFAEVLIEPEFQLPTLSAAEIRAQAGVPPAPVPIIPESFTVQLYNPDQQVVVRGEKSAWTGKESFEFEIPQQTFRLPSSSKLDRQQNDPVANSLTPKILFKWKRESKFNKDMTCYMSGRSVDGKKSKEPDITVAFYKHGREPAITIYEPNLRRIEVEDRKGLEVVMLLGAEVIREIYLSPNRDSFNTNGAPPSRRKNSRPLAPSPGSPKPDHYAMTSAIGGAAPRKTTSPVTQQPTPPQDVEIKRLQAVAQQEERERERRDKAEQKRIKKMLEDEEREQRKRQAEVEKETERLRREFGMAGQNYGPKPNLPPRPSPNPSSNAGRPALHLQTPAPPPRPVSAGPRPAGAGYSSWFSGPALGPGMVPPPTQFFGSAQPQSQARPGRRRGGSGDGKIHKKKSTFF
ncbi:hypothetical protein HD806DRAFT_475537 [Xylariaceae sp. AK1471]|nr:hypothetical protein HD806DRAFT_475537 [Xylariaceae sp. AK1471]